MGGLMGIAVAVFGVFWTIIALSMGAGPIALFGVIFVIIAVMQTVYHFKNATGKNRYSQFDITDDSEEPDPLNQRFGNRSSADRTTPTDSKSTAFCPYCGNSVAEDYEFCPKCGEKLP